ncbi:MAG: methylenetetrahydrofolate reductase C-terminal domain-containing protein [Chloroflexota bacterium]
MKSITRQKPTAEILEQLNGLGSIFIIGCGTCTTMTRTGGIDEVIEMRERLKQAGKMVTGVSVVPVACDDMTEVNLRENQDAIQSADAILAMPCALGVQKINSYLMKPVIPALDTLFIGLEFRPGDFHEVCAQCGQCVIGWTGGICPITYCHKHMVNGPCGGTNNGKCEVSKEKDCAWTLIYQRLKEIGRLDLMRRYRPIQNAQVTPRPRVTLVT